MEQLAKIVRLCSIIKSEGLRRHTRGEDKILSILYSVMNKDGTQNNL